MPLPARAVIFIVGSAATGATGLVVGTVGGVQMKRAHSQIKAQAAHYSDRHVIHQENNEATKRCSSVAWRNAGSRASRGHLSNARLS